MFLARGRCEIFIHRSREGNFNVPYIMLGTGGKCQREPRSAVILTKKNDKVLVSENAGL